MSEAYLGDSVYVHAENGGLLLYLNNGLGNENPIFIKPEVYAALLRFVAQLKESSDA